MEKPLYTDSPLMRRPNLPSTSNKKAKWSGWLNKTSIDGNSSTKKSSSETKKAAEKEFEEKESDVTISETVVSIVETSSVASGQLLKEDNLHADLLNQYKRCEELLKKIKNQLGMSAVENK